MSVPALVCRPVLALSLRSLLGRRRALALGLLNLLPIIVTTVSLTGARDRPDAVARLVGHLLLPVVVALVALALAGAAIGDEREDGLILHLTQTPVPRGAIVGAKLLAVWVATLVVCAPSLAAAAVLASQRDGGSAAAWTLAAAVLTALAYAAAFSWLALRLRRAVITGLLYVILWEGSIASFAASASRFSVSAYGRAVARRASPGAAWDATPAVSTATAIVVLLAIAAVGWWLAARRLDRMELP